MNYISVTAGEYACSLREAIIKGDLSATNLASYKIKNATPDQLITWVESHDDYTEGGTHTMTTMQIEHGWALIAARKGINPLFFSRPMDYSSDNKWGINKVGVPGDSHYKSKVITYLNKFKILMRKHEEFLYNPYENNSLLIIERGDEGMVIVNAQKEIYLKDVRTRLKNGIYFDHITGDKYVVEKEKIRGIVRAYGIVILF